MSELKRICPIAHCPECGYWQEGLSGDHRCPECGAHIGAADLIVREPARRFGVGTVLVAIVTLYATFLLIAYAVLGEFAQFCVTALIVGALGTYWGRRLTRRRAYIVIEGRAVRFRQTGKAAQRVHFSEVATAVVMPISHEVALLREDGRQTALLPAWREFDLATAVDVSEAINRRIETARAGAANT